MAELLKWISDYLGPIVVVTPFVLFLLVMFIGATVEFWEEGFYFFTKRFNKPTPAGDDNARQFPAGRFDKRLATSRYESAAESPASQSIHSQSAAA